MKINRLKKYLLISGSLLMFIPRGAIAQQNKITIDASKVVKQITPYLYGACIEDVNHEIYGGLYDQKIFGESFEESIRGYSFDDFTKYDGSWTAQENGVAVDSNSGAKLVYEPIIITNGVVEVELRLSSGSATDNAGILLYVNEPGNGADNFIGYEISLAADGKKVIFGKHNNNWQPLKEVDVDFNPHKWNKLKARFDRGQLEIILNDKSLLLYEDKDSPILQGKVALRTWNSQAEFRNLVIEQDGKKKQISFAGKTGLAISSHWDAMQTSDAEVIYFQDDKEAYNGKYSQIIKKENSEGIAGITNKSLNRWGISVGNGQKFEGRLYLKGEEYKGAVTVALQSADGTREYAFQTINTLSDNWEKYSFSLLSNATDPNSRLAIYIDRPGKVWVDQVVFMSTGDKQFHGLPFRNDIGVAMQKQGLTFLRYGGTMVNAPEYRFKKMIGDPDKRPPYKGHWNPYSTNGFGIEEFLKFCEAAGFEAAFAVNVEESPKDIADMVEYLNGSISTEWGKKRADNGHPLPYGVKYIQIGNEEVIHADNKDDYSHYIDRFNLLYDAIKNKDKSIEVINSAWWRPESPNMEMVFHALNGKSLYWDYHPWADGLDSGTNVDKELDAMQQLFLKWDPNTQMKCTIFEENGNLHNMQRALGHVTLQNAVRRHSDFVFTSCAANALQPYLQNDNGWDQGQVFFTPTQVWGMPPYYAQQMASENHLPFLIKSETNTPLDVTATKSEDGRQLVVHIVNVADKAVETDMVLKGMRGIKNIEVTTLNGELNDRNTPEQPDRIVPIKKCMKANENMKYTFPAYSYTILKYNK